MEILTGDHQQHSHEVHETMQYAQALPEGESEWGSRITELSPSQRASRSIDEVLLAPDAAAQYIDTLIDDGKVIFDENASEKSDYGFVNISRAELEETGSAEEYRGIYSIDPASVTNPKLSELLATKSSIEKREVARRKLRSMLDKDYESFSSSFIGEAEKVTQVYQVENGRGGSFRIYNFSDTALGGRTLHKMINAVREMDDLTGGESSKGLQALGIFPENNPSWNSVGVGAEVGASKVLASAMNGTIAINEALIKVPHEIDTAPTDGKAFNVGGDDIETTVFHELTHIVERPLVSTKDETLPSEQFGWSVPRTNTGYVDLDTKPTFVGEVDGPSLYATAAPGEDVAESAAALFAGGEWHKHINDERVIALQGLYKRRHSGQSGPAFIRCNELNLADYGVYKIGMDIVESKAAPGSMTADGKVVVRPNMNFNIDF